jgi:hypothetical protein
MNEKDYGNAEKIPGFLHVNEADPRPASDHRLVHPRDTLAATVQPGGFTAMPGDAFINGERVGLPTEAKQRKQIPLVTGVLDYFPDALCAVAEVSRAGNDQHNPGQPLHWAREKSNDHVDCVGRHLIERGTIDTDGQRHTAKAAWRILALLQLEIEASRAAK